MTKQTKPGSGIVKGFTHHVQKGSQQERLPSRHAMTTLTQGDPVQRSMGNYAKATPSGPNADSASIVDMDCAPYANPVRG